MSKTLVEQRILPSICTLVLIVACAFSSPIFANETVKALETTEEVSLQFLIIDDDTGKRVEGVTIRLFKELGGALLEELKTNARGKAYAEDKYPYGLYVLLITRGEKTHLCFVSVMPPPFKLIKSSTVCCVYFWIERGLWYFR